MVDQLFMILQNQTVILIYLIKHHYHNLGLPKAELHIHFIFQTAVLYNVENSNQNIIADDYQLLQNYPNPFNPTTSISFSLPQSGLVKLTVYDILGNEIEVLVNDFLNAGIYTTTFNAAKVYPAEYMFIEYESEEFVNAKQMILLK